MKRCTVVIALAVALPVLAEDENARRAREELERELTHLVGKQPTRVRVEFEALDEPNYALEETVFELDGKALRGPAPSTLTNEGSHLIWSGDVAPGKHVVHARVVYVNTASALIAEEGGHRWKVSGDVSFEVPSGIEVQVRVVPLHDPTQREVTKRFRLSLPAKPVMVAQLDDGTMPEPVALRPAVDAGERVMVASARRAVVERVPAESPVADVEPELAPLALPRPANDPVVRAPEPTPAPAPEPEPAPVDAPPAPVHEQPVAAAPAAVSPPPEESAMPWLAIGGGAVVALVAGSILMLRRRARPPTLD